jgi:hypothetical protein
MDSEVSGKDVEQTADTYKPNTCNKAFIETSQPNLSN